MNIKFLQLALVAAALLLPASLASAQKPVKIGVLTDMNSIVADSVGKGSVLAAQFAIDDAGPVLGRKAELVAADSQLKPNVASTIARRWYDSEGVDMITDLTNSAVALAVQGLARERGKIDIVTGAGTTDLYGKQCSPTGFQWVYDSYVLSHALGQAVYAEGGHTWFFITADYVFGHQLEKATAEVLTALGGKVLGDALMPQDAGDFSGPLVQAAASHAQVIGIANFGADAVNTIKQAHEFNLVAQGQRLAALLLFINDTHGVGLGAMQGTYVTTAYYWDQNDQTRAFAKRFQAQMGRPPSMLQAGVYSAVNHYLKAVKAAGSTDGAAVAEAMRRMPVEDFMTHNGKIRPDGRLVRDMYLERAKKPAESHDSWDLYAVLRTIPGENILPSVREAGCPFAQQTH
jgi:branched-chain amino acid transport system substrate-binding protein